MPPNELESYALSLVRAMLNVRDLPADDDTSQQVGQEVAAQRASAHKRQAEMLTELTAYLLDHYVLCGYSGIILAHALLAQTRKWALEQLRRRIDRSQ